MEIDYSGVSKEIQRQHYIIEPASDLPQPQFKRFLSADPAFPISIAYPGHLQEDFSGSAVSFSDDQQWLFAVTRWEVGSQVARNLFGRMERDMKEFTGDHYSRLRPDLAAVRYWIEGLESRTSGSLRNWLTNDTRSEYLRGPGIIGNREQKVPRAVWLTPSGHYGERIYFQRESEPLILWTITRHPEAELTPADYKAVLWSFRWLSDMHFYSLGVRWPS